MKNAGYTVESFRPVVNMASIGRTRAVVFKLTVPAKSSHVHPPFYAYHLSGNGSKLTR
jgi:hypothetical protein